MDPGLIRYRTPGLQLEPEGGPDRQDRRDRLRGQPEDDGEVGVAEEAEREVGVAEHVEGLDLTEDVGVLVHRRAMGDCEGLVHHDGPLGQRLQPLEIGPRELAPRPHRGFQGDPVEHLAVLDSGADLVVVAPDSNEGLQGPEQVHRLVGIGAVAHQVPEEHDLVPAFAPHEGQDGPQRLLVRVDVGQNEVLHLSASFEPRCRIASTIRRATTSAPSADESTARSARR